MRVVKDVRAHRSARSWTGALALVVSSVALCATAEASAHEPATGATSGLAVSYAAPPPTLVLTPYASLEVPVNRDWPAGPVDVAILPDGGAVVVAGEPANRAILVGGDGTTSAPIPLDVVPGLIVATAGPVVYGLVPGTPEHDLAMVAIALAGPNAGHVVARTPVDRNIYVELPAGSFGNGPTGVLDRVRQPGALLAQHADTTGAPVTVEGLRGPLTISPENLVTDASSPARQWQLAIERHPETSAPFAGESPPAPGANGTSVYWTTIGPAASPSSDFSENLQPVIAVLQPDGTGQWYSIPDGWSVVSSDVAGTLFARRVDGGDVVELARLDPSATGPAPVPIPPLASQCDGYEFNNAYPLRLCDSGEAVRLAQTALRAVDPDIAADGYFGPLTERAVRTFQAQRGLEVDGLVGPDTWAALTADIAVGTDIDSNGVIEPWELGAEPDGAAPPDRVYYWVVVVAASPDSSDPLIDQAMVDVAAAGFRYGVAITGCEDGSSEALGHPPGEVVVSIQFPSEADALQGQADLAERGVNSAVAYVSTTCLD